jgi:hypothetical protein
MRKHTQGFLVVVAAFIVVGATAACTAADTRARAADTASSANGDAVNALTAAEQAEGWRLLFDGQSTTGWRRYRGEGLSDGWQVIDGALVRVTAGAGDIVTVDRFRNFDLRLQWKVAPGGNAGIFYRATEDSDLIWHSAPEMQVLDDERHPDGRSELTSAGALYAMYPAQRGAVRPAGEWNDARVLLDGSRGEHWLNGVKLFEFEIGSPDWETRLRASKFATLPAFGRATEGHIGLQDHEAAEGFQGPEDRVEFRNIRIRVLP